MVVGNKGLFIIAYWQVQTKVFLFNFVALKIRQVFHPKKKGKEKNSNLY
jgi:hypothetical protein